MINNVEQDGRQLFLSADHCGGGNADSWILMFNFQVCPRRGGACLWVGGHQWSVHQQDWCVTKREAGR